MNDEAYTFHQIYLARGRDLAGNQYHLPGEVSQELLERRQKHGRKGH